jgi:hypothetical protein
MRDTKGKNALGRSIITSGKCNGPGVSCDEASVKILDTILAKYHFLFLEDTFATAGTFRITPAGTYHSDPKGTEFKL